MAMREHDPACPPFKGFLAWKGYRGNLGELAALELGDSGTYRPLAEDMFAIGIGGADLRQKIFRHYKALGARFYTLCHPNVWICPSAKIGKANVLHSGCYVGPDAVIGDGNYLNGSVIIGHDAEMGDFNVLNILTLLGGAARMKDLNQFAPNCQLLPKARIGSRNVLAPASVVYKGCGDDCLLAGNPALIMEKRKTA